MFQRIAKTIVNKIAVQALSFALILLTTNLLGAEGKGIIALFLLNITLSVMGSNFIGGAAMVYLIPRYNFKQLATLSYSWAATSSLFISSVLHFTNLSSGVPFFLLFLASFLQSFIAVTLMILWGANAIKQHNFLVFFQAAALLLLVGAFLFWVDPNVTNYINALLIAYTGTAVYGLYLIRLKTVQNSVRLNATKLPIMQLVRIVLKYGFWVQTGNIAQLFNYRFSYYILERSPELGLYYLGVFSTGIQLSEALWVFSRSAALVQYSEISNNKSKLEAKQTTKKLLSFNGVATALGLGIALCIPKSWYTFIFGSEFESVKLVLIYMSIGIVINALSSAYSHYFSGIGLHKTNAISSSLGLLATLVLGLLLIPSYNFLGAAIATSAAFAISTAYQAIRFHQ